MSQQAGALCRLPFETQKQCKTHQVACKKCLKGTIQSPAPAPSPPAARWPAAPEPQQRKLTLQAAVKKPASVTRPAEPGDAIGKVPAALGNITQVLTSKRPISPSHIAKKISMLRRLSAASRPVQHVPVSRRISVPPCIAARDPATGRSTPPLGLPCELQLPEEPEPHLRPTNSRHHWRNQPHCHTKARGLHRQMD
ncbi:unnamed protein product [Caretta caretta]